MNVPLSFTYTLFTTEEVACQDSIEITFAEDDRMALTEDVSGKLQSVAQAELAADLLHGRDAWWTVIQS